MGLITRFKSAYDSFVHPEMLNGSIFYTVNGTNRTDQNILKDFQEIPELNAVINWRGSAFRNMNLRVVNKKTGEDIENPISEILKNPNWFQAQGEFLRQTKLFHDIFGNEYIKGLAPVGMSANIKALFTLPPQNVEIDIQDKTPFFLTTGNDGVIYTYDWAGKEIPLDKETLMHLNDNRVDIDDCNYLKGTSKVEAIRVPLDNIRAAYEARGVNIRNNGPMGIISSQQRDGMGSTMPLLPKEKEEVQEQLRKYGAMSNQYKYIVSSNSLAFSQISADTDKLKTFEEVEADFDKVCDAFMVSKDIFSTSNNSTYENKSNAEKGAYQDGIIPDSIEWIDAINKLFETKNKPYVIAGDFGHLAIFQDNLKERADAISTITNALSTQLADGVITVEDYKEQIAPYYE